MVFKILTCNFYLEEKKQLFIWMQAHHNEEIKELVYPTLNIVLC